MLTLPDESEKNPTGQILKNPWRGESGAEGVCGEVIEANGAAESKIRRLPVLVVCFSGYQRNTESRLLGVTEDPGDTVRHAG